VVSRSSTPSSRGRGGYKGNRDAASLAPRHLPGMTSLRHTLKPADHVEAGLLSTRVLGGHSQFLAVGSGLRHGRSESHRPVLDGEVFIVRPVVLGGTAGEKQNKRVAHRTSVVKFAPSIGQEVSSLVLTGGSRGLVARPSHLYSSHA